MEVNVHQAKTHLSRLLQRVEAGEEVTISRAGVPVARLVSVGPAGAVRPMGMDRDSIWIAPDFDAPNPELEELFYAPIPGVNSPLKRNPIRTTAGPRKKPRKKA